MIKHYSAKETYTVKLTKPIFFEMIPRKAGDIITVRGNLYADLIGRGACVDYDPALDDTKEVPIDVIASLPTDEAGLAKQSVEPEQPKKLGPKKKIKKDKGA